MAEELSKYYVTCPICSSPNVAVDATARWDFATQAWLLYGTFDNRSCDDCGYESSGFTATYSGELTPEQKLTIETGADYKENSCED